MLKKGIFRAYPEPTLRNTRLALREWSEGDLDCVRQAATDVTIPQGTTVPAVYSPDTALAFIHRQWGRLTGTEGISLAIAHPSTDEALGLMVLLYREEKGVVGIGYWVVPNARRQGFASAAAELLSRWALTEIGISRVEAHVQPDNDASKRTLIAAGFRHEGLLRSYLDYATHRSDALVFSRIQSDL